MTATASSIETVEAETPSSFREKLPRVYELKDMLADPSHPGAYFQNLEDGLDRSKSKLNAFVKLERQLAVLDVNAWADLKERAAFVLQRREPGRGWQSLFDVFSEARGFGHLVSIGCTDVRFIKRTKDKTPDIGALRDGSRVFCEVKTINISSDEAEMGDVFGEHRLAEHPGQARKRRRRTGAPRSAARTADWLRRITRQ